MTLTCSGSALPRLRCCRFPNSLHLVSDFWLRLRRADTHFGTVLPGGSRSVALRWPLRFPPSKNSVAATPGLTVEAHVRDVSGRPGIGVVWHFYGSKAM